MSRPTGKVNFYIGKQKPRTFPTVCPAFGPSVYFGLTKQKMTVCLGQLVAYGSTMHTIFLESTPFEVCE